MNDGSDRAGTGATAGADRSDAAIDPAALLGEDIQTVERVLTGRSAGPLAVCGPPFGGRERVLELAADRLGADLLRLAPGDDAEDVLSTLGDGPVVVDNGQHLYERRVGGFEPLESVLRAIVECEEPVVMGWNSYAWAYLARVRGIDRTFATRAEIESLATADLAALVLDRYDDVSTFLADEDEHEELFTLRTYGIEWRGFDLSVPVPFPGRAGVTTPLEDDTVDPKDVVFERLAAVSKGNVGVATAIWETSRREELRPSDIVASGIDLDLDREEAFCLRIVLLKERVRRAELARIVDDVERVLGRLLREDVLAAADDVVRLEPTAVPSVVTETERRGLH